jgi:hypothetical protein
MESSHGRFCTDNWQQVKARLIDARKMVRPMVPARATLTCGATHRLSKKKKKKIDRNYCTISLIQKA